MGECLNEWKAEWEHLVFSLPLIQAKSLAKNCTSFS